METIEHCRSGASSANSKSANAVYAAAEADWLGGLGTALLEIKRLFARQSESFAAKALSMKHYSLLAIIAALTCSTLLAQDKAALQPNATIVGLLPGGAGKSVELHLRSGEKMGGKVAQVTDNIVHLSNLTGAEYFDAFIDVKDVSAVVVRVAGR
jgi:hypothetical protein